MSDEQVQVVYEGATPAQSHPLVAQVGYVVEDYELPRDQPTTIPADVFRDLVDDPHKRHVGHKFRQATKADLEALGVATDGVTGLVDSDKPKRGSAEGNQGGGS